MGIKVQVVVAVAAMCLAGCASSSIKKTWKSPEYQGGPVQKPAVIGVDDRGIVRKGFENRFVRDLREHGQEAIVTYELMALPDIKADKDAAAARLREAGADSVLIVRLVDQVNYDSQVRASPALFAPTVTGIGSYYGWYDYYSVAFTEMGTVWSSTKQLAYLDISLYSLKSSQRIWSGLTKATIKETTDRVEVVDALVSKVVDAMRKDGVVR
jgi:hypothetical protein